MKYAIALILATVAILPAQAELRFVRKTIRLGKIRSGLPQKQRFDFINASAEAIEIIEARPGCGCVVPTVTQKIIPPGGNGSIPIELKTLGQSAGPKRWYVYLSYRQGKQVHQIPLQVVTEVVTEVTVQPAAVKIRANRGVRQEIRLTDLRSEPLQIKSLRASSPHLHLSAGSPARDRFGHFVTKILLRLDDRFPDGRHEEYVIIDTDDPVYSELKVPVSVVKIAPAAVTVIPSRVDLQSGPGQPSPSRLLVVRATGDKRVEIDKIKADHPAIRCKWAKGPGNNATVRVWVDEGALRQKMLATMIHIYVSAPRRAVLAVAVRFRSSTHP